VSGEGAALGGALAALRRELGEQLVAEVRLPAEPSRHGEISPPLAAPLAGALAERGVDRLWSHQAEALAAARAGRDVLLTTATASGKSLVFQLPALEAALAGEKGRALWLFPLKALGQDQRAKLRALAAAAGIEPRGLCEIYDGDTPPSRRAAIRRSPPRVLISNPEMLHLGLLPHAASWRELLGDLRWIVLDELHTYRGLFGSHFHHVLVRLGRLARAAGARPAVIAASATAAEADLFAGTLAGREFDWIRESGAPREARHFLMVRPEASPYTAALDLYRTLVRAGLKTIVFTKARRITELLRAWLERRDPEVAKRTRSYRAGYLAEERREIERALLAGELDGVLSTSALELGIDIGGLDACVLVGYPGSAMATWQRAGRVGRSGRESIVALVALPDALDQYLLDHPRELLERPLERLVLDPGNEAVARQHLVCAAAEAPLDRTDDAGYLERFAPLVGELISEGRLARSADGSAIVSLARRPHREVSLRGVGASFVIVDGATGETIGTVDGGRVFGECHPGAIYLHAGRQYAVDELDLERGYVVVRASDVDWYTTPRSEKETEILELLSERPEGSLRAGLGRLRVTERVVGYERRRTQSAEALDVVPLELPPSIYETQGLWIHAPEAAAADWAAAGANLLGALHAAEHASIGLFPLVVLCDRNDLGGISLTSHPQLGGPGYFVYEGHVGGVGIAARGFELLPDLIGHTVELLERCPCDAGCPGCIHSPKCGNGNRPLDKGGALALLRTLLVDPRPPRAVAGHLPVSDARSSAENAQEDGSRRDTDRGRSTALAGDERRSEKGEAPVGADSRDAESSSQRFGGGRARRPRRQRIRDEEGEATPAPGSPSGLRPADSRAHGRSRSDGRERARPPSSEASPDLAASDRVERPRGVAGRTTPRSGAPRKTVLFDVETMRSAEEVGGWNRAHRMGISVAVALHLEEGRFATYFEADVPALIAELKSADLVVGYNSRRFDYAVLSGYTGEDYARSLATLDLLESLREKLRFRVGLDHVARETLGRGKSGDGLQSLEWVKQGRLDLVEAYCRDDVEILRDVYLFGRREGYVVVTSKSAGRIRVPVEW